MREQKAIERVLMQGRQIGDEDDVLARDRRFLVAVVDERAAQHSSIDLKIGAAEAGFDRVLPEAGGAEEQVVDRIVNDGARGGGHFLRLGGRPEQEMRVEQKFHGER